MSTSCSCLKLCSVAVALSNLSMGLYILADGSMALQKGLTTLNTLDPEHEMTFGPVIVEFQISSVLIFVGLLLLIGIIKEKEKLISLYFLLSSLIWFIVTMLAVSYMVYYNTTTHSMVIEKHKNGTMTTTTTTTTPSPLPKPTVPVEKAVGFSIGLVLVWCGQLGVYKFHDQVIEKNVIDAGESYVSSAIYSN